MSFREKLLLAGLTFASRKELLIEFCVRGMDAGSESCWWRVTEGEGNVLEESAILSAMETL
jgi:hypothetical protein